MHHKVLSCAAAVLFLLGAAPNPDAAFKDGDFAAARRIYGQIVAAQPNDVNALLGLATTELYDNDLASAQRDLQRAQKLDPSNERARRLARTLMMRSGKPGEFANTQHGDAVLPFVEQEPLPTVHMRINGALANVAIDTGGPVFTVTSAFARAHHLRVVSAGMGIFAGGRRAPIQETTIALIAAGSLKVRNVSATVMEAPSPDVDAIVGTAFFTHFLTTLDYTGHRLIFRPREGTPPTSVASVPMWLVGDHFIFARASINGGAQALFNVDSGSSMGVQLSKASLDAAHITPQSDKAQQFVGGGGAARILPFTTNSVSIGGAMQRNVSGIYFPDGDQFGIFPFTVAGTVSGGFLSHYAVTFDFKAMRLILQ